MDFGFAPVLFVLLAAFALATALLSTPRSTVVGVPSRRHPQSDAPASFEAAPRTLGRYLFAERALVRSAPSRAAPDGRGGARLRRRRRSARSG